MSGTESPASVLRRAAALMRKRAEAATPGPWEHPMDLDVTHGYRMHNGRHVATWLANCDAGDGDIPDEQAQANADHIASWHPGVALAVADWLEAEAGHYDDLAGTAYGTAGAAFVAGDFGGDVDPAIKVARAYLGETPEAAA